MPEVVRRAGAALAALAVLLGARAAGAAPADGWRLRFAAALPGLADKGALTLGASVSALDGRDDFDDPHPPAWPQRYLDLVTRHASSDAGWRTQELPELGYRAEYQPPLDGAARALDFELHADQAGTVVLSWATAPDLDLAQHFLTLHDLDAGASVDMWTSSSLSVAVTPGVHRIRVELQPGRSAPPIAFDQVLTTAEDTPLALLLTADDPEGDPLSYAIIVPLCQDR